MTEEKNGESFFRKVARFVANPATDWGELQSRQDDPQADAAKAELREMIERKRRNDFVRKRELDMLRRIRRDGLSPEQLAALGSGSSDLDSERMGSKDSRIDLGVKAKIDEIEQQMVGNESFAHTASNANASRAFAPTAPLPATNFNSPVDVQSVLARVTELPPAQAPERATPAAPVPTAAVMVGTGVSPLSDGKPSQIPTLTNVTGTSFKPTESGSVEVSEVVHDAELDEAVFAFANADYDSCERSLVDLTRPGGVRNLQSETWLVLFDFYRASGQADKFDALAADYSHQFALSAPQWLSLPKQVSEFQRLQAPARGTPGAPCWTAPEKLDAASVKLLQTRSEPQPMPWIMDWRPFSEIDVEGAELLTALLKSWALRRIEIRWLGGDVLLQRLRELTPVLEREVNPALWMLRLEALRVCNRPDQFDEAAIDFCLTYEVSPPSWESVQCTLKMASERLTTVRTTFAPDSIDAGPSTTSFMESMVGPPDAMASTVSLELLGQLSGDISETLATMRAAIGDASIIEIACPLLIRLDFVAAGDLLNWVLSRLGENRNVIFKDTHRLVALFFSAMGISEHASVKVRQN